VKRKIDEVYRWDPEVTASELKNVLENELTGIRIGVSTIKRARKAAGWICSRHVIVKWSETRTRSSVWNFAGRS